MKAHLSLGIAALALALSGCGGDGDSDLNAVAANSNAPLNQIAAPDNGDWTQVVAETPDGGFRMGNPNAPVKLVEYASITCPHCAEFAEQGSQPLQQQFVRSGQVSWEYRPFLLFPSDPAVFMLMRCKGASAFFTLADQLYASQSDWISRLQAMPPEQQQALQGATPAEQSRAIIAQTGLDQFFRQRGMPEAQINACLADQAQLERLAEITRTGAEQNGVTGTPTFFINGQKVDAGNWPQLEQRLRAAIG